MVLMAALAVVAGMSDIGARQPQLDIDSAGSLAPLVLEPANPPPTEYSYAGDADPSAPGGMSAIYHDLAADESRFAQVAGDVAEALSRGRHCLVLAQWVSQLNQIGDALRAGGYDPVILRGGMGAKARAYALARLHPDEGGPPLLAVATRFYMGEGFDCPALDTLFLAAPVAFKGRLVQYVGRILRSYPGKTSAEVHDYHDSHTGVIAAALAKRAPGCTSLGFPDPHKLTPTLSNPV